MPVRVPSGVLDPAVQFVWVDGRVMAWNPEVPFRGLSSVVHHPNQRVVALHLPGEPSHDRVPVVCRVVPLTTLDALADVGTVDEGMQPSVAWFAAMHDYARRLVRSGRVVPHLEPHAELPPQRDGAAWWRVTWVPLAVDVHAAGVLLGAAPPAAVSAAGPHAEPRLILAAMVDRVTRATLSASGWYTSLPEIRSSTARAVRLVGRSLAAESALFSVPPELADAVEALASEFADLERRANGEPVVRLRLRLSTPAGSGDLDDAVFADAVHGDGGSAGGSVGDGADGWPLDAEIVDVDDRSKWCDVRALAERLPAGLDVARGEHHTPSVLAQVEAALRSIIDDLPGLAPWVGDVLSGGTMLSVDIDAASAVLDAVESLAERGIEIIVPERLVRGAAVTRGIARPAEPGAGAAGRSGLARFGARSLVEWQVVVDDTPVSEEALRRAAEGGASLIESGGRWVQIDRADAESALIRLAEHRLQHADLSPLELLELAAELAAARAGAHLGSPSSPARRRAASRPSTTVDEIEHEAGAAPHGAELHGAELHGAELHGAGWAADLLAGLPDTTSRDGVVPSGFTATLRPYQLRGLGWLQGLRELGLGGCLADDMGLGKTPTTLAHLAGVDGPHLVVCPLSVVHNWETEAARFTPGLRVLVHHGAARADGDAFTDSVAVHDIVVTTYQVATRDIDLLRVIEWSTLVLDEAQMVKNPDTATARALRTVRAGQALALTGTPVENRLRELWSIFNIVVPGLLGSGANFRDRFATPIERQRDAAATAALRQLTGPFLLRRT
ncbi:MAG: SNF2-related protein, partial [Ilumatobacteraceae bacterium]